MSEDQKHPTRSLNLTLYIAIFEVFLIVCVIWIAFALGENSTVSVYTAIAMGIIVLWIALLVPYLAWALHFFNINFGLPPKDWEDIKNKREAMFKEVKENMNFESAGTVDFEKRMNSMLSLRGLEIPKKNPFAHETMGLPPGTIRGILAVTVLVGGLAMFIASMGMDSQLDNNTFFIDTLDFFKTAFLMVIAFYFGSKSLETFKESIDIDRLREDHILIKKNTGMGTTPIIGASTVGVIGGTTTGAAVVNNPASQITPESTRAGDAQDIHQILKGTEPAGSEEGKSDRE